jgi:YD repeat-containing protein
MGRLERITQPDPGGNLAPYTVYTYDDNSNRKTETNALGELTTYFYDEYNHIESITQPNGDTITYGYDAVGNRTSHIDGVLNTTTYQYDNLNRLITETSVALNDFRTFKYDLNGNREEQTDRNGRVTKYEYDHLDRLTDELWVIMGADVPEFTYTYDAAGRLTNTWSTAATYAYTYDNLDRQKTVTSTIAGITTVVLTSGYDRANNRTSLAATVGISNDFVNNYIYDALGRMTQIEQTGNGGNFVAHKQVGFTYNKNGQFTGLNRFNQHVSDPTLATGALAASAYDYDAVGRLTDLDHVLTGITLAHDWGYDRANRVDTYLNSLDGAISYDYDESGQLEEVSGAENNTYTYDDNGNRIGTNIVQGDPNRIVSDGT